MMDALVKWAKAHRRLLVLKGVVAVILVVAHYFPDNNASLIANLIWLLVF